MLTHQFKITKKSDIEKLARTGRRLGSVFFILKFKPNSLVNSRWVIIVSAKVSKKAVQRNRLRRQVREIIRTQILPTDTLKADFMLVVKDNAVDQSFLALKTDLLSLYNKIQINKVSKNINYKYKK